MKKVLIIDDSPFMSQMFAIKLHEEGFEPLVAGEGKTGIAMAQVEEPAVILLDISMPHMDGWEVLKNLKNDARTSKIPVLILTNSASGTNNQEKAKEAGAEEYILKIGQKVDDILKIVNKYL